MQDKVVYCGIAIAAGTRHELDSENGMAHFCEHMSFKGTPRLSSVQISRRMESVGADLNAFTGKEETVYYVTCLRSHLRRAIPLLMDMVFHSTYAQPEIDKEVEVVIDEIESYEDSPADLIFDDFESLLYSQHPLGRSILGQAERLRQYRSDDFLNYVHRAYRPEHAILFVMGEPLRQRGEWLRKDALVGNWQISGDGDFWYQRLGSNVTTIGRGDEKSKAPFSPLNDVGGQRRVCKHTHQAHVMLGARGYGMDDVRHMGLCLLSNLLGGPAMSSRLNLALRERRGLCYTVESNVTAYTDTSTWAIYFGCDHEDVDRCLRMVRGELHRLVERPLSAAALKAAKRQFCGQLTIAHEQRESVALGIAKRILHTGHARPLGEMLALIEAFTAEQLQQIAAEVMHPNHLTTLIYGSSDK